MCCCRHWIFDFRRRGSTGFQQEVFGFESKLEDWPACCWCCAQDTPPNRFLGVGGWGAATRLARYCGVFTAVVAAGAVVSFPKLPQEKRDLVSSRRWAKYSAASRRGVTARREGIQRRGKRLEQSSTSSCAKIPADLKTRSLVSPPLPSALSLTRLSAPA